MFKRYATLSRSPHCLPTVKPGLFLVPFIARTMSHPLSGCRMWWHLQTRPSTEGLQTGAYANGALKLTLDISPYYNICEKTRE